MLPADQLGSDNAKNLRDAIKASRRLPHLPLHDTTMPGALRQGLPHQTSAPELAYAWSSPQLPIQCMLRMQVASSAVTQQLEGGAFVVMNDDIHLAQYVRK